MAPAHGECLILNTQHPALGVGGWWLTFDDLLHQRTVGPLVGAVHNAIGYPRQVAHVAMPPAPLSPVREGGQSAGEEESLHKSRDGHRHQPSGPGLDTGFQSGLAKDSGAFVGSLRMQIRDKPCSEALQESSKGDGTEQAEAASGIVGGHTGARRA